MDSVLIVVPVPMEVVRRGVGGGVAVTYRVVKAELEARGHRVTLASPWNAAFEGVEFPSFNRGFRCILPSPSNMRRLRRLIRRFFRRQRRPGRGGHGEDSIASDSSTHCVSHALFAVRLGRRTRARGRQGQARARCSRQLHATI